MQWTWEGYHFHPQFDFFTLLQGRPNLRSLEDVGEAGLTGHLPSVAGGAPSLTISCCLKRPKTPVLQAGDTW